MQLPTIPLIENVSDLLNILGDKTVFGQRLKEMNALNEILIARNQRYEQVTDIEGTKNQAAGLLADAKQVKSQADSYSVKRKLEADDYYATEVKKIEDALVELADRNVGLEAREKSVEGQTAANSAKEHEIAERERTAATTMETATQRQKEAESLAATLRTKLNAFNQIAAD